MSTAAEQDVWLPIEVEGKRGFVDATGAIRVPPRHDFVQQLAPDRVFVRDGGSAALLDADGATVFAVDAWVMRPFQEGLAPFVRGSTPAEAMGNRWGLIDGSGQVVVEPTHRSIFAGPRNGLVTVEDDQGRRQLVDLEGQPAIPDAKEVDLQAGDLIAFRDGKAKKKRFGLYSLSRREVVVESAYDAIFFKGDGCVLKKAARKWGAANAAGEVVIEPTLPWLGPVSEDRAATRDAAGAVGFVDGTGKLVVPHRFESRTTQEDFSRFADGRCGVQIDGRIGFIDRDGEVVVPARFLNGFLFGEGRGAVVDEGGWTYIDEAGAPITEERFERAETFGDGIGVVHRGGARGAVRRDGTLIVPTACRSVAAKDGVLRLNDADGRAAYYRRDGSCIWRHAAHALELEAPVIERSA